MARSGYKTNIARKRSLLREDVGEILGARTSIPGFLRVALGRMRGI